MLSTLQKLGQLKHQARTVYRLKNEIDRLKTEMETRRRYMIQVNTVLTVQREMAETFERSTVPPTHLIQMYAEIYRRQEEWDETENAIETFDKEVAYHHYRLQKLQRVIMVSIQEVKTEAELHDILFDFDSVYQAIQDTGCETV
jgi:uncharacterized protein (DUF3084 family)